MISISPLNPMIASWQPALYPAKTVTVFQGPQLNISLKEELAESIIRKLDTMKNEPGTKYENSTEARNHIKKLMNG